jgi:hypothetical protein
MMQNQIVILSSHSLFADGIASRLRQYPQRASVQFIDPRQPDYIAEIKNLRPVAVLMDAADTGIGQCCLMCDLLLNLLDVTIIRLEVQRKDIQVVTSVQQSIDEVKEIIDIIAQSGQVLDL